MNSYDSNIHNTSEMAEATPPYTSSDSEKDALLHPVNRSQPQNPFQQTHSAEQSYYQPQYGSGLPPAHPNNTNNASIPRQDVKYVALEYLASASAPTKCPSCDQVTMTRAVHETGNTTHAWAAGLCVLACLGCIPYCVDGTRDVSHYCGSCNLKLAKWHRSGRTEVIMRM